jgi:hypothetical protein
MPTYKLGPPESILKAKNGCPRMLLCERCGESLGVVDSEVGPEVWSGMPAVVVAYRWPQLKMDAGVHELLCEAR